ncbi:MAG: hypothetical protein ABIQ90_16435 [Polaromonas sp.]
MERERHSQAKVVSGLLATIKPQGAYRYKKNELKKPDVLQHRA